MATNNSNKNAQDTQEINAQAHSNGDQGTNPHSVNFDDAAGTAAIHHEMYLAYQAASTTAERFVDFKAKLAAQKVRELEATGEFAKAFQGYLSLGSSGEQSAINSFAEQIQGFTVQEVENVFFQLPGGAKAQNYLSAAGATN